MVLLRYLYGVVRDVVKHTKFILVKHELQLLLRECCDIVCGEGEECCWYGRAEVDIEWPILELSCCGCLLMKITYFHFDAEYARTDCNIVWVYVLWLFALTELLR